MNSLEINDERTDVLDNSIYQQAKRGSHRDVPDLISQYKAMFSPHMPAAIVGRQKGWKYCMYFPFTSLRCEWTKAAWLFEWSFDKSKMQITKVNINLPRGHPSWDY